MQPDPRLREEMEQRLRDTEVRLEKLREGRRFLNESGAGEAGRAVVWDDELEAGIAEAFAEGERIEGSLRRMDERTYGCCMTCGANVDPGLLQDYPHAVNCRKCALDFPATYSEKIGLQHHKVLEKLQRLGVRLDDLIARLRDGGEALGRVSLCVTLIGDFDWVIRAHFAMEERGGYLAEALARAPRFHRRAAALQREHHLLRKVSEGLTARSREAAECFEQWQRLREDFERFARDLQAHESQENEIVSSAFLDDLGGRS